MINRLKKLKIQFSLIILLIFCNGLIYSQGQEVELPNGSGFFIYEVPDKQRIIKKIKELETYSLEELTTVSKWTYHLTASSCKLYLDRDSSLYHFNEAYKIKPKSTCIKMRVRHNAFIKALKKSKESGIEDGYIRIIKEETGDSIFSWYLWDLPDFDEFAFIDSCNLKYPIKNVVSVVKDSTLNSEIIRRRDQRYRSINDLEKQHELDQINRDFVDSLFLLKGSLDEFDEDEIYQFSMVAHHSEDCDWVYKWTERFIDHSSRGYKGKSLLGPLLERMLNAKDGYCTNQDPQKREYFVNMIKDKYPYFVKKAQLSW